MVRLLLAHMISITWSSSQHARTWANRTSEEISLEHAGPVKASSELTVQRTVADAAFRFETTSCDINKKQIQVGATVCVQYRICPR